MSIIERESKRDAQNPLHDGSLHRHSSWADMRHLGQMNTMITWLARLTQTAR
jgi:hypothetical protein